MTCRVTPRARRGDLSPRPRRLLPLSLLLVAATWPTAASAEHLANHLVITKVGFDTNTEALPNSSEYIEIYNPTNSPITLNAGAVPGQQNGLGSYFLSDSPTNYYTVPAGPVTVTTNSDSILQFPANAVIPPRGIVVVCGDADNFITEFFAGDINNWKKLPGSPQLFESKQDGAGDGIPDMILRSTGGGTFSVLNLTNGGEPAILYYWDGKAATVQDVDMVVWQNAGQIPNKSAVTGYQPDKPTTAVAGTIPTGGGNVMALVRFNILEKDELSAGSNGIGGHDETSESWTSQWGYRKHQPGLLNVRIDDGTISDAISFLAPAAVSAAKSTGGNPAAYGDDGTLSELYVATVDTNEDRVPDGLYVAVRGALFGEPDTNNANTKLVLVDVDPEKSTGVTKLQAGGNQLSDTSGALDAQITRSGFELKVPGTTTLGIDAVLGSDVSNPSSGDPTGWRSWGTGGTTGATDNFAWLGSQTNFAFDGNINALFVGAPGTGFAAPDGFEGSIAFSALTPNVTPAYVWLAAVTTAGDGANASPNTLPESANDQYIFPQPIDSGVCFDVAASRVVRYYVDGDGDGFGGALSPYCGPPKQGLVAAGGDCNDADNTVKPGGTEKCNGADDNCDGQKDEGGDTLCQAGQICDAALQPPACRAGCRKNADCAGATPVCNTQKATCVECLANNDCSGDKPACDTNTGTCGCAADADCANVAGKTTCDPALKKCVQCTANNANACTGSTPVCNASTGTCAECNANVDCPGSKPVCSNNKCTGCTGDTDCANRTGTNACNTDGACVQCTANNANACTGATPLCSTTTNKCVQCNVSADCGLSAPVCAAGACTACSGDGDCTGRQGFPACNAQSGACVQCTATNLNACGGAKPVCDAGASKCVECNVNADCGPSKPACSAKVCTTCTGDGDCTGRQGLEVCNAQTGACVQCSANNTSACSGSTKVCDTGASKCVQCLSNNDCGGTTPTCDTNTKMCSGCKSDADCANVPGRTVCDSAGGTCVECTDANANACTGATPLCNATTRSCVECNVTADCGASKPLCAGNKCTACKVDLDCAARPGTPACNVTSGACVQCTSGNVRGCGGTTPVCDATANKCVQCNTRSDCPAPSPVCDATTHMCKGCTADTECDNRPGLNACNVVTGGCVQCSTTNATACTGATPVCNPSTSRCALCVPGDGDAGGNSTACAKEPDGKACLASSNGTLFCGCDVDADCGAQTSGRVCDTINHRCQDGCSPAPNRNHCPAGQYCTTDDMTGKTVGRCTTSCVFDADCAASPKQPFCLAAGDAGSSACVSCRNDADCAKDPDAKVCEPTNHTCVVCTGTRKDACAADKTGAACLANNTCGCDADSDCGDKASGRICDVKVHACVEGCRGTDGNGCPSGLVCSSSNADPGTCGAPPDLWMPDLMVADSALPAGPLTDGAVADLRRTDAAPDLSRRDLTQGGTDDAGTDTPNGGGCACTIGGSDASRDASGRGVAIAVGLGLLVVLGLRRRRR